MQTKTFKLSGLTCPACKKLTEKRIGSIPEVTKVEVTLATGEAVVNSDKEITVLQIKEVLKETPYQVVE
jgi:copper chaperone